MKPAGGDAGAAGGEHRYNALCKEGHVAGGLLRAKGQPPERSL